MISGRKIFIFTKWILIGAIFLLVIPPRWYKSIYTKLYRMERKFLQNQTLSHCSGYLKSESPNTVLYYTPPDSEFIPLIRRTVELYYPLLAKDFDLNPLPQVIVVVYPTQQAMKNSVKHEGNAPIGVYYGGVLHILSPHAYAGELDEVQAKSIFLEKGPMVHELTHFTLDMKANGNYDLWFTEGVALYYEYKYTAFEWRYDLHEESRAIETARLVNDFRNLDENLAYRRAFDVIHSLVKQNGEYALQTLVKELSGGGKVKLVSTLPQ